MTRLHSRLAVFALGTVIVLTASLYACGTSGGGGNSTGPTPSGAISLSLSAQNASIAQGGQYSLTATVTKLNGYTGGVTLLVQGVPAGVTHNLGTLTGTGATSAATITLSIAGTTAAGSHNITVQATGSGVQTVTSTFALTITALPSGGVHAADR